MAAAESGPQGLEGSGKVANQYDAKNGENGINYTVHC